MDVSHQLVHLKSLCRSKYSWYSRKGISFDGVFSFSFTNFVYKL